MQVRTEASSSACKIKETANTSYSHLAGALPDTKTKDFPQISVVVATLNSQNTLGHCIESFQKQTYQLKELVVVDGGSTDRTVELLSANGGTVTSWISEPDNGICDAWNKALTRVHGEWIIFLGADDIFFSNDTLERAAQRLSMTRDACLVAYGQVMTVTPTGIPVGTWGSSWPTTRKRFHSVMTMPHQGVFHRRRLFDMAGKFDKRLKYAGDYDLLLRTCRLSDPEYLDGLIVTKMTTGGLSSRPSQSWKVLDEFRQARLRLDLPGFTPYWGWAYFKALIKAGVAFLIGNRMTTTIIRSVKKRC